MTKLKKSDVIVEIPVEEKGNFKKIIKVYRKKFIRNSESLVNEVFTENKPLIKDLKAGKASEVIEKAREFVWKKYLIEEEVFNTNLLTDLGILLETPKNILDGILKEGLDSRKLVGRYAGRVFPYIYELSLSNTNSRRSRSGSVFQYIIYRVYGELGYNFDSQKKVGKKIFSDAKLGKIVDSVLPGIKEFEEKRSKTIIGTMKTSLRERWQEVVEEIQRTGIPQIFLLTVDNEISQEKAEKMGRHNVTLVVPERLTKITPIKEMKNIISFEEYLFKEIPSTISYWKNIED